jgi:phosphate transport system substrate-binding protein
MTDVQLQAAPGRLLHIPVALGAVVATYNLPGNPELRFTPELLADVFLGKIAKWNDKQIKAVNGDVDLPALDITLVHRSDSSGTTYILADYLSKVSLQWRDRIGRGTSLKWASGVGAKGNEGVIRQVKNTVGSVGYAELTYAVANRLPVALIRNKAGKFVEPNLQSTTAAAAGAFGDIPADFRASLTDAPGEAAYPIVSFTWALVYQEQADEAKGKALVNFLWWAMRDGQAYARDLNYAPLPLPVVSRVEATLHEVTHRGRPLLMAR